MSRRRWTDRLRGLRTPTGDAARTSEVHRIVYESGNEHDPADPFGLCVLDLRADGAAHLTNRRRGVERSYHASTRPGVFDQLAQHLRDAGFPDVPGHVIPAGPTRRLQVHASGGHQHMPPIAYYEALRWPGYREAFHLLDGLVVAVSQGDLPVVPAPDAGLTEL